MGGRDLHELFLLNLTLQVFDGVATWHGLPHWSEGNPGIRAAMDTVGAAPAILLYKAQACGCLLLVRRLPATRLAAPGLALGAGLYFGLSFVPWLARLLSLAWS